MTRTGLCGYPCARASVPAVWRTRRTAQATPHIRFIGPKYHREIDMKKTLIALALLCLPLAAAAQGWNMPPESQRCPSKWGAGDELGSSNHMKNPQHALRGARAVKTREIISLSQVLSPAMPIQATRVYQLHPKRTAMNPGRNTRGSNE